MCFIRNHHSMPQIKHVQIISPLFSSTTSVPNLFLQFIRVTTRRSPELLLLQTYEISPYRDTSSKINVVCEKSSEALKTFLTFDKQPGHARFFKLSEPPRAASLVSRERSIVAICQKQPRRTSSCDLWLTISGEWHATIF